MYAGDQNNLLSDPESELTGKFALMPARFKTEKRPDLAITKEVVKTDKTDKTYEAPNGKPKFRLKVSYIGKRPLRKVVVKDLLFAIRDGMAFRPVEVADVTVVKRKRTTPVECDEKKDKDAIFRLVKCKTKEMREDGEFTVVITTRIVASGAALSYQRLLRDLSPPFTYSNQGSVEGTVGKRRSRKQLSELDFDGFDILAGAADCPGDIVRGTSAADVLSAAPASQTMVGLGGADQIFGGEGRDCILGGAGNDQTLDGGGGADWIDGGPGKDNITSAAGPAVGDTIWGGPGNDDIEAFNGVKDMIDCGPGKKDKVTFDKGLDVLVRCEKRTAGP